MDSVSVGVAGMTRSIRSLCEMRLGVSELLFEVVMADLEDEVVESILGAEFRSDFMDVSLRERGVSEEVVMEGVSVGEKLGVSGSVFVKVGVIWGR